MAVIQNDLCAGGDIAGRDINNVYHNYQPITWYQRKFQSLAAEIENDHRYDKTIEDLEYFETVLDGRKGLQNKLKDGGHSELDISTALRQKQKFAKKQEKYKYYESAQWINSHLFADILMRFNDYVKPLIEANEAKNIIMSSVFKNVIDPIKPDIVLRKYKTCIFINGCFWHGHDGCKYFVIPKTRTEFWHAKIERNKERDSENKQQLASMGWHCITIWECQLKPKVREVTLESLLYTLSLISLKSHKAKSYELLEESSLMVAEP